MELVFATFESELNHEEIIETMRQRAAKFREVEGLVQKYFVHDRDNDRYGACFVFDSERSRDAYFESELSASVGDAYAITGDPSVTKAHLLFPLREVDEWGLEAVRVE
ncbi:YdhR family protein [Halobellus captivus]|uniref:YdhR family protein n=1 Tax=Halobellus captivus TaxID=2592614 RepID=UPI0011A1D5A8|nr:YdhR family protein [Halobellus captivus]